MSRTKNVVSVVRGDGEPEDFVFFACPESGCDYNTGDWAVKYEQEARGNYNRHWQETHAIVPDPTTERWTGVQGWTEVS